MNHEDIRSLYLDLLKSALMDVLQSGREHYAPLPKTARVSWKLHLLRQFDSLLQRKGYRIVRKAPLDIAERMQGKGTWPMHAQTMIGMARLNNVQMCIESVIADKVPGDLIETGVWRGGTTIFMRAVLKAYGVSDRVVWVVDSFEGLPEPDAARYPADAGLAYHEHEELVVPLQEVKENFTKYGLLDDQVKFLKGWFRDTLPVAPIERLALLRLDGDLYESTMDALKNLYPKLSPGGYVIIDDFHWIEACRRAVDDYRKEHSVGDKIVDVDWTAVYWRKSA